QTCALPIFWRTCSSRALKLRQSEGTVKIALSFCTSSAYMGDLTSFLAVVVCVRSPFFRVKWLILPGQPVTPRKRYSIHLTGPPPVPCRSAAARALPWLAVLCRAPPCLAEPCGVRQCLAADCRSLPRLAVPFPALPFLAVPC